jgi:hypothetical protein
VSRYFDGGTAADFITFSVGSAPPDQGPITLAALARANNTNFTGWLMQGLNGGTAVWAMLGAAAAPTRLYMENDFGAGGPTVPNGDWCWFVATKASGSALPRFHLKNITTGAAWVHINGTANTPDGSGPITSWRIGSGGAINTTWRGEIAVAAHWTSQLNDAAVEAACTLAATDLLAAAPGGMFRFNQASTATPVPDDTGNGGNQSAISGTAVDADEPPGWDYALSAPANALTAAITLPALQASTVLSPRASVSVAVSLPALQAAGQLAATSALASALSLPALQASTALSSRTSLATGLSLPRLALSAILSVPVAPAEDTSSPDAPISTVTRAAVIATISRDHVISTGSRGGPSA